MPKLDGPPPYDCSKLSGFDRDYCLIDRFEACALEAACPRAAGDCSPSAQVRAIGFARCVEFVHQTDPKFNRPCAASNGFDADALATCAAATSGANSATEIMTYIYSTANTSSPVRRGLPALRPLTSRSHDRPPSLSFAGRDGLPRHPHQRRRAAQLLAQLGPGRGDRAMQGVHRREAARVRISCPPKLPRRPGPDLPLSDLRGGVARGST